MFVLACVVTAAPADQLLMMPTARRLPPGLFRAEVWTNRQLAAGTVTAGLGQAWDAQISLDRFGFDPGRPTGALSYYYLTPIADLTPGIGGGILDVANATTDGRRLYACATMNRSIPKLNRYGYAELTAGFELGRRPGPMAGLRVPAARNVSVLGEYDGFRFNFGAEGKFGGGVYARLAARGGVGYVVIGFRS